MDTLKEWWEICDWDAEENGDGEGGEGGEGLPFLILNRRFR